MKSSTYLIQYIIFNVLNAEFNKWILEHYSFSVMSCSPWTVLCLDVRAYSFFFTTFCHDLDLARHGHSDSQCFTRSILIYLK